MQIDSNEIKNWHKKISDKFGEEIFFPLNYIEKYDYNTALEDIITFKEKSIEFKFSIDANLNLKVYSHDNSIILTRVINMLSNFGITALRETPYKIKVNNKTFNLSIFKLDKSIVNKVKDNELLLENIKQVYLNQSEDDVLNVLSLNSGLSIKQINLIRTYLNYLHQIKFYYSKSFVERCLINNYELTKLIVIKFESTFKSTSCEDTDLKIIQEISNLEKQDDDLIYKKIIEVINATVRTNYFLGKDYISLKIQSSKISDIPKPIPLFEIFIYSKEFEGIHLRKSKVSRGGIRWSDRIDDFRTEVLGLMKAQSVKNSVIVPDGAKGGFIIKNESLKPNICYTNFIISLLELTDNIVDNNIIKPDNVIALDNDDPYLVVAADKGTSTYSDLANSIASKFNFWMKDAFASGSSNGYDHKRLGITANGTWESIKIHLLVQDRDLESNFISTIGIGDMSGDVFGNGMLYTNKIKLLGAFNHLHIFIDPNPDSIKSFNERERLFNNKLGWEHYEKSILSLGGRIYSRKDKNLILTDEIKSLLNINNDSITPDLLIQALLKSKVDLIFNGGIGTYIKASFEENFHAMDKVNDKTRVNAIELNCKMIGEGGNLGMTQNARVEYSSCGGLVYSDFIDNAGGVNCSDREVNLKILLNKIVAKKEISEEQKNLILAKCEKTIANKVLFDNFKQAFMVSALTAGSNANNVLYSNYIKWLESNGDLIRSEEFLPDEKSINQRVSDGIGFTRPSISILFAYTKKVIAKELTNSNLMEDEFVNQYIYKYFPHQIINQFEQEIKEHPLKKDIVINQIASIFVDEMGITFLYRLQNETNATISDIIKSYLAIREILSVEKNLFELHKSGKIKFNERLLFIHQQIRLVKRLTRWWILNNKYLNKISDSISTYSNMFNEYLNYCDSYNQKNNSDKFTTKKQYLTNSYPDSISNFICSIRSLYSCLVVIDLKEKTNLSLKNCFDTYFSISEYLGLNWLRGKVIHMPINSNFDSFAREALRDDLDSAHFQITTIILNKYKNNSILWKENNSNFITKWNSIIGNYQEEQKLTLTILFSLIRELSNQKW